MKNRRNKSRYKPLPEGLKIALKWICYCLLGVFAFLGATSGGSSKALLMIPLAVSVAIFEGEIPSAAMGVFMGLLCDISADKLLGFTAFYLCVVAGGISALFRQLMRKNIFNFAWIYLLAGGIYLYLDYYFFYEIWQREGYESVVSSVIIPSAIKTYFFGFVMFIIVYLLWRVFGPTRRLNIEEHSVMIDRL